MRAPQPSQPPQTWKAQSQKSQKAGILLPRLSFPGAQSAPAFRVQMFTHSWILHSKELSPGSFKKWPKRVTRVCLKSHGVRSLTCHRQKQTSNLSVQGGRTQFSEVFLNFAAVKGRKAVTKIILFKLCLHSATNAKCTAPCSGKTNPLSSTHIYDFASNWLLGLQVETFAHGKKQWQYFFLASKQILSTHRKVWYLHSSPFVVCLYVPFCQ